MDNLAVNTLYHHIIEHVVDSEFERCPGSTEICALLNVLSTENKIPIRFYHQKGNVRYEYKEDTPDLEFKCVHLFELFVQEYNEILLPATESVAQELTNIQTDEL